MCACVVSAKISFYIYSNLHVYSYRTAYMCRRTASLGTWGLHIATWLCQKRVCIGSAASHGLCRYIILTCMCVQNVLITIRWLVSSVVIGIRIVNKKVQDHTSQKSVFFFFFRVEGGVWGIYILYCTWWRWGGKCCHVFTWKTHYIVTYAYPAGLVHIIYSVDTVFSLAPHSVSWR